MHSTSLWLSQAMALLTSLGVMLPRVVLTYERHDYSIVFSRLQPMFYRHSPLLNTSPLSAEWHKHSHDKPWEQFWVVSGPQVSSSAASGAMQPGDARMQDQNSQPWETWSVAQCRWQLQLWETLSQIMGSTMVSEDTTCTELASVWQHESAAISLISLLRALC